VYEGEVALVIAHDDRLRVGKAGAASGRVTGVPQRDAAAQPAQDLIIEGVAGTAVRLVQGGDAIVHCADAGCLLSAVLQSIQPEEGCLRRTVDSGYANDSAHKSCYPRSAAVCMSRGMAS
jgi:hypothetical protein